MDKTMAPTKLCVAGNEGIDKKMETAIIGYVETRTRRWSPLLSYLCLAGNEEWKRNWKLL